MYTYHVEATREPEGLIAQIRERGMKVGVALKPKTPIAAVLHLVEKVETIPYPRAGTPRPSAVGNITMSY